MELYNLSFWGVFSLLVQNLCPVFLKSCYFLDVKAITEAVHLTNRYFAECFIFYTVITEVVEKAKEGYESNVSDLEEDDSVIYQTLGGESSSTISGSDKSGER